MVRRGQLMAHSSWLIEIRDEKREKLEFMRQKPGARDWKTSFS